MVCVFLASSARYREAEQEIRRALELEPLSPIVAHMAAALSILARKYGDAIDLCSRGLEIDPHYPLVRLWLGVAYEQESRYEDAIRELETALQILGVSPLAMGARGHVHAMTGNQAEAKRLLHELVQSIERGLGDPYAVALIHAGLGERDQAFEWLNKAADSRASWLTILAKSDPRMDALRPDPQFQNILRRMGLDQ